MCSNWCTLVSRSLPYPITYSSLYHVISVPFILYHKHTAHLLVTKQYNPTTKNTQQPISNFMPPFHAICEVFEVCKCVQVRTLRLSRQQHSDHGSGPFASRVSKFLKFSPSLLGFFRGTFPHAQSHNHWQSISEALLVLFWLLPSSKG